LVGLIQGQLFSPPPARLTAESRLQAARIAQSRTSLAPPALCRGRKRAMGSAESKLTGSAQSRRQPAS